MEHDSSQREVLAPVQYVSTLMTSTKKTEPVSKASMLSDSLAYQVPGDAKRRSGSQAEMGAGSWYLMPVSAGEDEAVMVVEHLCT